MAWYDFIKGFFSKNPPNRNEDLEELLEMLKSMTEDLTFTSEENFPFEVIAWQKTTKRLDLAALPHYLEIENPEIEAIKVDKFLRGQTKTRRSYSIEKLEKADRFKQILAFFQSQVSYPMAFKVGQKKQEIYILGIAANNYIIGLKSFSIEKE